MDDKPLDPDPELVRKLARLLEETGLREIEYAEGDKRIRCATGPVLVAAETPATTATPNVATPPGQTRPVPVIAGRPVPSPMVGTVYLSPEPGKPAFVKKGDAVKEGDTLVIIEAMKVMNPIKAPCAGTVADVMVADATPVEFGETLIVIS